MHRKSAVFLASVLAEFIFVIQQASLFGRNSVDVYETVSLAAINGRGSNGNCLNVRRTNTGYAASTCACTRHPAPAPLSTFVLTGPLQWLPPATFDAGPFGKLSVNGIVTGFSQFQNNPVPGDDSAQATLSNGEIFIQKADGNLQWFVQAGVYTMPTLQRAVC